MNVNSGHEDGICHGDVPPPSMNGQIDQANSSAPQTPTYDDSLHQAVCFFDNEVERTEYSFLLFFGLSYDGSVQT